MLIMMSVYNPVSEVDHVVVIVLVLQDQFCQSVQLFRLTAQR